MDILEEPREELDIHRIVDSIEQEIPAIIIQAEIIHPTLQECADGWLEHFETKRANCVDTAPRKGAEFRTPFGAREQASGARWNRNDPFVQPFCFALATHQCSRNGNWTFAIFLPKLECRRANPIIIEEQL
jgi:hypothetical protein